MDAQLSMLVRRAFRTIVLVAVLGVLANDGVQLAIVLTHASDGLDAAMSAALASAAQKPDDVEAGRAAAAAAAEAAEARLDAYNQVVGEALGTKRAQVSLTVSSRMGKTVLAAPVVGLTRQTAREMWYEDPRISLTSMKQVDLYGE
jgi:hypothetical protein